MRNIAHIFVGNGIGGAETLIKNLILSDKSNRNEHIVICRKGILSGFFKKNNIKVVIYISLIDLIFKVSKIKKTTFHCHDPKAAFIVSLTKNRIVLHIHGNHNYLKTKNLKTIILLFFVLPKTNLYIWISSQALQNFVYYERVKDISKILPNFVSTEFKPSSIYFNYILPINRKYDYIFLGRLDKIKQPLLFIEFLMLQLKERIIKAVIVGDGSMHKEVKELLSSYKIEKFVDLVGFKTNVWEFLNDSRILVNVSTSEGFPISFIEAASCGTVIAHTQDNFFLNDYLTDTNSIQGNNIYELNKKTLSLISNEKALNLMSKDITNSFSSLYNPSIYIDSLNNLYDKLQK